MAGHSTLGPGPIRERCRLALNGRGHIGRSSEPHPVVRFYLACGSRVGGPIVRLWGG